MSERVETIEVKGSEAGVRLDRWFRIHFPDVGHVYLQKLLRSGQVRVDSRRASAGDRLEAGAQIRVPKIARIAKTNVPAASVPALSRADRSSFCK